MNNLSQSDSNVFSINFFFSATVKENEKRYVKGDNQELDWLEEMRIRPMTDQ